MENRKAEPILVNPNASDNAKRLMKYMCDIYGTDILSGQYCDGGMHCRHLFQGCALLSFQRSFQSLLAA